MHLNYIGGIEINGLLIAFDGLLWGN